MRLERLNEYLTTATAVIVGAVTAYVIGTYAGEGSIGTVLAILSGFIFTGLVLLLKQHVWVLIPILISYEGELPKIPLHLALRDVVILLVLGTTFMLTAIKAIRYRPKFTMLDFWLWANLLYLFITYLRHPTGGYVLQSDRIGGRAYLNVAIAMAGYWVLKRSYIPRVWNPRWVALWVIGASVFNGVIQIVTYFMPRVAGAIATLYSGVYLPPEAAPAGFANPTEDAPERYGFLAATAYPVINGLLGAFRPFTLINPAYLGRFLVFAGALALLMLAGFRSGLIAVAVCFVIASFMRSGSMEVIRVGALGVIGVMVLVVTSYFVHLPMAIQRTLTILPGRWDSYAVVSAQHSTDWRLFMWKEMMFTDTYIKNKWLGDGFGFTMQQYQQMFTRSEHQAQVNFMITGQVHSGPISTIRFVGYVGLLLYLILLTVLAVEAYRLAKLSQGKPLGLLVWYFAIPSIWHPLSYVFIFGAYDADLPGVILSIGLISMLRNSVDLTAQPSERDDNVSRQRTGPKVRRLPLPRRPRPEFQPSL